MAADQASQLIELGALGQADAAHSRETVVDAQTASARFEQRLQRNPEVTAPGFRTANPVGPGGQGRPVARRPAPIGLLPLLQTGGRRPTCQLLAALAQLEPPDRITTGKTGCARSQHQRGRFARPRGLPPPRRCHHQGQAGCGKPNAQPQCTQPNSQREWSRARCTLTSSPNRPRTAESVLLRCLGSAMSSSSDPAAHQHPDPPP